MAHQLGELLRWGKETLKSASLEDYDISAELLLQAVLNLNRSQLLLNPNSIIKSTDIEKYKEFINQRARRVPLQYLIGWVEFFNIKLQIDKRALIPRPETEILVETVIRKLQGVSSPAILDIGTGSGNIAIALAKNNAGSEVTGIDISEEALELARSNAKINLVENSTHWICLDITNEIFRKSLGMFDCVVSNPPYVTLEERDSLQPEVIEHEPHIALFSGNDPLIFFRAIIRNSLYILKNGGLLAFEVGMGQAKDISEMMKANLNKIDTIRDLAGIERVVTGIYGGSG
jgi:release factor glutamine methyltransferase